MEKNWLELLPVYGVEQDLILSKQGDITIGYRMTKPEIFSLSEQQYEELNKCFVRAIRALPANSILHLQDWYTTVNYTPSFKGADGEEKSFLGRASERYFNERPWLDHQAYLFVTCRAGEKKRSSSAFSGLLYPRSVAPLAMKPETVREFLEACGQAVQILEDSGLLKLERLGSGALWGAHPMGLIEQYCSLQTDRQPMLKDIRFGDRLQVGDQHCALFTLADAEDLPEHCAPRIDYYPYSTDWSRFSIGFASGLGPLLSCNHICNQYVFREPVTEIIQRVEARRKKMQSLAAYSRENADSQAACDAYLNEAVTGQRLPVRAHFNVLCWTDTPEELPRLKNRVGGAVALLDASPHLETAGAPQIWWAGIPGNEGDFPMNDSFDTFAEQAACFFQVEGNYRTSVSPLGMRLGDRVSGRPLQVDIDHEPRKKGITGNGNMFVLSGSGGGKSFAMNHLLRAYYEQGWHTVVIDVGHSYQVQCELHGGYYFTYEEENPMRFNPFYTASGETFDTEKKESLKTLLLSLCKAPNETPSRSEYVGLSTALQAYFDKTVSEGGFRCFNSFYEFLDADFRQRMETEGVKQKEFDLDNFLYVLRPYYQGGEFDYLLNATENLDLLEQRFIVFELDNIKDHPILFPVVTLIIMELFVSKMRKLRGEMKAIVIEEAWKPIATGRGAEYIKFLFKTVRKFSAKAVVVTQEVEDIISSEIVKNAIINNSDIKILLDQSKFQNKFDEIQQLLGITDKQKAEILSINKAHAPGSHYKDLWIALGAEHSKVYRLEVSPEEYYVYTSDQGEKKLVREYIDKYGSVKAGVRMLVEDLKEKLRKGAGPLLVALLAIMPGRSHAQVSIVGTVVAKVIKAIDLAVQRVQTETIWLEEAQKEVENAMSKLDLQDIRDWVQDQHDLYAEYFEELKEVKSVISYYHEISEIVMLQEQMLASYKQSYGLLSQDPHFSAVELAHMTAVYARMIGDGSNVLAQLQPVINSFGSQMSDAERLSLIDKARAAMEKLYLDLQRFNNQNALLSIQRAGEAGEIELLKKLYGL